MRKPIAIFGVLLVFSVFSPALLSAQQGLVAWWKFDKAKGNMTLDSVSQIKDSINGNFGYIEGVTGSCIRFDGYTTSVTRKAVDAPKLTDAFTIEAWVALQVCPWNWTAIANQEKKHRSGYFFGVDAGGHIGLQVATDGEWYECVSKTKIPCLKWSHIAGTFDKNNGITVYVNGKAVATLPVKGEMDFAEDVELWIGKSHTKMYPLGTEREPSKKMLSRMIFDGLIDEVKIYNRALSAEEIEQSFAAVKPRKAQPLTWRVMPSGPDGPGRFGAYYCKLKYCDEWDNLWRVGPYADILVRFDESPVKVVFWRGTNYGPAWVAENGRWMTDESFEGGSEWGCSEHMSDKQCRYSHVRIIENNDARVVIHWRYAPVDIRYVINNPNPETGWGDWADEYYTIYPDCVAVRKQVLWSDVDMGEFGRQETIFFNQPGTTPEDNVELEALTLANMKGETHTYSWVDGSPREFDEPDAPNILMTNLKAENKPFIIFVPGTSINTMWYEPETREEIVHFPFWNHWPVAQVPNEGRNAVGPDRPSHSSLASQHAPYVRGEGVSQIIVSLYGMTENPVSKLVPLARSWVYPAQLSVTSSGFSSNGYDKYQRAYVLTRTGAGKSLPLEFGLSASEGSPVVNPAFVVKNWGEKKIELEINGKAIEPSNLFRQGLYRRLDGTDLIIFLKKEIMEPVKIKISPVK